MKTYAIAVVVIAMLAVAFTVSVFPQKKESTHRGQMFMQEKIMKGERGLRPHVSGSHKEEMFRNEQRLSFPVTSDRGGTSFSKFLSDTMYLLISDVGATWDTNANVWVNSWKDSSTYDANGNETEYLEQEWNGSAWVNDWKDTLAYDANGRETGDVSQMWNDSAWVTSGKATFAYDANGRDTGDVYQTWNGSAWVNSEKYTYSFDANGRETGGVSQMWNGGAWVNESKYTYSDTGEVYQTWNGSAWVNESKYTYSDTGDVYQTWNDSVWVNESKYTYSDTGAVYQTWNGTEWVNSEKYTYSFDANGRETEDVYQMWNGSAWVNRSKDTLTWQILITGVNGQANAIGGFALSVNYPNPFNPQTKISFFVPKESYITLKVYDLLGREVATLAQGKKEVGEYSVAWSAGSVPSGIYFYRFEATGLSDPGKMFVQVKKMLLLK